MLLKFTRRQFLTSTMALFGAGYFRFARAKSALPKLPIPSLIDGSGGEPVDLVIDAGEWSFMPGVVSQTLGFSQSYLGPTIRMRQHRQVTLNYENRLAESVAVHGHGLHVPGEVDGGPQLEIEPGGRWTPTLSIVQPAATCWYHAHTHGTTGALVYKGLAGMMIIDDAHSDSLDLPRTYGVDDLPVIIQDKTFDAAGNLVYSLEDAGDDGWEGDTVVINGAVNPVATVPAGKVRLRILNGANARFYVLRFADDRVFYKIASDGGLLESPVPLTTMEVAPGERCEIVVDMVDGVSVRLLTLFETDVGGEGFVGSLLSGFGLFGSSAEEQSLTLLVDSSLPAHTADLPEGLNTIERPLDSEIMVVREFVLEMDGAGDGGHGGGHGGMAINGAAMDMGVINERVEQGVWERWRIRSDQGEHPFHVHGCSFLVDKIGGEDVPLDQQGWKDMVVVDDDGWSEIIVRFDYPASDQYPYMYHCHILEHEDHGMMGQFTVS